MAHLGELLAELRQDRGLTQDQLAEIISVSPGTISNYEHGRHLPDLDKLKLPAGTHLLQHPNRPSSKEARRWENSL